MNTEKIAASGLGMLAGWIVAGLLILLTVACSNTTTTTPPAQTSAPVTAPGRFTTTYQEMPSGVPDINVYTDSKTGCEFLYLHEGEGNATTLIPHTCTEDKR
jgi:hypothetical protein